MMQKLQFQYLVALGLVILLGVLAFFQYTWVGQISEAEKERLQKRLDLDAQHFSDDFNRIIQNAYFSFQTNGDNWNNNFLEHYELWQQKSIYPTLIKEFIVVQHDGVIARFDSGSGKFLSIRGDYSFASFSGNFKPINEKDLTLTMPIYDQSNRLQNIQLQNPIPSPLIQTPNVLAYLVIKLDAEVIKNQIIPDLTKKYFPEGDFKLSLSGNGQNEPLFQMSKLDRVDARVPLFELMPEGMAFFIDRNLRTTLNNLEEKGQFIFRQNVENSIGRIPQTSTSSVKIQILNSNPNQILNRTMVASSGLWTLNIQHKDGSLEQFVDNTRRKNLLISFGILGLLGGSIGFIFLTAQRAQVLAQRQLDFVSAVSHEFRTPISVIYSAAENLADGIAREEQQVSRYGNLIKDEGKKLSGMVEQILEFAGARSGRKKYDFRDADIKQIVADALKDCQPLIAENNFEVETEIQENLPLIKVDKDSIFHAVQNLIINGIKYSNNNNWLKVSLKNGDETVKIIVEDKGIGIPKKDLKHIFTPFYRAKEVVDAQIHGNGLGLSLVKQTVDAHQGQIKVQSEIGKGSKFIIVLPQLEK
jgi:signal transduction histidine kinase